MKLCQSMQHIDERPNKDRKKLLVNKSTMDDSASNSSSIISNNYEAALNRSNCVIQQKMKASHKQVAKQKMFTRVSKAPSKLTFLDDSSIS